MLCCHVDVSLLWYQTFHRQCEENHLPNVDAVTQFVSQYAYFMKPALPSPSASFLGLSCLRVSMGFTACGPATYLVHQAWLAVGRAGGVVVT